jgi:hypothetical protein
MVFHIAWKRFDQMIKSQPKTPAMMVEQNGKDDGHDKEQRKDSFVVAAEKGQAEQVNHQNYHLGSNNVREDGAYKKPLLALEDCATGCASSLDLEWSLDYRCFATDWTSKPGAP